MITQAIIVWLLPLFSFAVVLLNSKRLPRQGDFLSLATIFIGLFISMKLFGQMMMQPAGYQENLSFGWIPIGAHSIQIGVHFDILTSIMLLVVTIVSSLVHLFSTKYMEGDPKYGRFFAYLSLFSFSMLGLVLADSLLGLYIFWELVGLSSYLLIGFWHEKPGPAYASKKAFITNRVGDFGMLLGILLIFAILGDLNLQLIFTAVADGKIPMGMLTIIGLLLFCGAVGKSAQFPLHVWLPDAMEGPTPVSALIHAATMVAAGVYLVGRIFPIITPDAGLVIAMVGGFTAFFAATIAIAQYDIKKVLAYSTISQLGYMIMGLGVGAYTAGLFHLVTHAMFKACLFLASGSVIHAMHYALHHSGSHADPQDMRNMGGMRKAMPITYLTMLLATLAISGVPFTSGFLSKDAILGATLAYAIENGGISWVLVFFGFITAAMTAFYMFRIIYKTFFGTFHGGADAEHHLHESPKPMTYPLIALATLSVFFWFTAPKFNPFSTNGWFSSQVVTPARAYAGIMHPGGTFYFHPEVTAKANEVAAEQKKQESERTEHFAHMLAMILSLCVAGFGIWLSWTTYLKHKVDTDAWKQRLGIVYEGMLHKWWMDELYDKTVIAGSLLFSKLMAWIDANFVDGIVNGSAWFFRNLSFGTGKFDNRVIDGAVNGLAWVVGRSGDRVRTIQTGNIQRYLWVTGCVVGTILIVVIASTLL